MNDIRNSYRRSSFSDDNHQFRHRDEPHYSSPRYQKYDPNYKIKYFLRALVSDRKLKIILTFGIVVILIVLIAILLLLWPILVRIFDFFIQNGIQGVVEYLTEILTQLWEGTGK
jgi:hypothetical protein